MKEILDNEGYPIYDYPELINSPHYQKYKDRMSFLVHRLYFEGTPISREDNLDAYRILDIQKLED